MVFEEAVNAVKFLGWLKKFEPAQNILGPVKGQGINFIISLIDLRNLVNSPIYDRVDSIFGVGNKYKEK